MQSVHKYMTQNVIAIPIGCPLLEAIDLMRKNRIGAVLINDEKGRTLGIFTERDVLNRIDFNNPENIKSLKIEDVMTKDLKTVDYHEEYVQALRLMQKYNIRHMPISQNGQIVGMVSLRDLMHHYEDNLQYQLSQQEQELKKKAVEIAESEMMFRTIFDNSAVAIIFVDQNKRIVAWNPYAAKLLGMTKDELLNKSVQELYPPQEWETIRSYNIHLYGQKHHLETKIINKKGDLIDVDMALSVLKDNQGNISGSIGILSDIRTRKRLTMMLDASVKELADLKAGLDEHAIVAIVDTQGKIIYANDKFCAVSKYSKDELLGQDFRIVSFEDPPNELWGTICSGKVWKGELKNKTKDGTVYWIEQTIVPIRDSEGNPYQFVIINSDITKLKDQEQQLRLTNIDLAANAKALKELVVDREKAYTRLKENQTQLIQLEKMATLGTLAAGFAHEIKNPLSIILQGMERIEKYFVKQNDSSQDPYVKMIRSAAERANKVVTSILRYSRSSQVEVMEVNIYDAIETAIALIYNNSKLHNIEINKHYENRGPTIFGDSIMLSQVFFDLFNNAVQAMENGGQIDVFVQFFTQENQYVINVKDTGCGIKPEHTAKIFDPFFTTKDEGIGTGLGLSTVYLILERHQGTIAVESHLGQGTTFTIQLPIIEKEKFNIIKEG